MFERKHGDDRRSEISPTIEDRNQGRKRVVIEKVQPEVDDGRFPIKRAVGETIVVSADILADGHDVLAAVLMHKGPNDSEWREAAMISKGNDRREGEFVVREVGIYLYTVQGWIDKFRTWQQEFKKRSEVGQDLEIQLMIGSHYVEEIAERASEEDKPKLIECAAILSRGKEMEERTKCALSDELTHLNEKYPDRQLVTTYDKELTVVVERPKALFSTWYERFPRSCSPNPEKHGTFSDCVKILPEVSRMGFDVWYLPPIHPIGETHRKGKDNSPQAEPGDPGSPWAIGSDEGGHKAVHPQLGTIKDFENLVKKAAEHGIEIALDLTFQCSPDHPYVKEHPEWFKWRPDGTVQHAENPPKKYEDIIPLNFETEQWQELWEELKSVVLFWAEKGVRLFRVDNPHTKPFRFWEWLIQECKQEYPDLIFLSEAFTRPKVMYQLAKAGFTQSYTYFTWRNTKPEFIDYVTHLLNTEVREFFRPNFWPNTPDILPEHLQYGGRPAFMMRLLLAATLSSSYGIYGPPFELCIREALPGKEEYLHSEKYELRLWDWDAPGNLKDFISRVNKIRRDNPALQTTWNLRFYEVDNEYLIFYGKATEDFSNIILVAVNLDPFHTQSGWVTVPIKDLGIPPEEPYLVHELLSDDKFIWHGEKNYVQLDPQVSPAHIFRVRKRIRRETDFDYYF
jgi:starch synthase (maltosyl-transferring)